MSDKQNSSKSKTKQLSRVYLHTPPIIKDNVKQNGIIMTEKSQNSIQQNEYDMDLLIEQNIKLKESLIESFQTITQLEKIIQQNQNDIQNIQQSHQMEIIYQNQIIENLQMDIKKKDEAERKQKTQNIQLMNQLQEKNLLIDENYFSKQQKKQKIQQNFCFAIKQLYLQCNKKEGSLNEIWTWIKGIISFQVKIQQQKHNSIQQIITTNSQEDMIHKIKSQIQENQELSK